jgi:hypothetical protein
MKTAHLSAHGGTFVAIILSTLFSHAQVTTLVDGNSPGYYNNSLGTILDGTAPQFPAPLGSGGGDPLINPSSEPNISAVTNILGNWLVPHSTLNANWQKLANIPATWAGNTETAIIYEIVNGTTGYSNVVADFDADNGVFVWVNGQYKFGARGPGLPSPAGQYEYTNIFLGNLPPGTNRIQVLREDNFDATGYQVRIVGIPFNSLPPQTCAPISSGLVSWWPGETNTIASDIVDGNNGSAVGSIASSAGLVGRAFDFNGSSYFDIPDALNLDLTNALTIEAWINPRVVTGSYHTILSKFSGVGDQRSYVLAIDPAGNMIFNGTSDGNLSGVIVTGTNTIPVNQWTHVAATYDGGFIRIYVNGNLQISSPWNLGIFAGSSVASIGATESFGTRTSFFDGLIDELSLYRRALSANEIQSIYAAGSAGKCDSTNPPPPLCTTVPAGVVAWWKGETGANDSAGTNTGSVSGDVSFATSKVSQGFVFGGSTGSVIAPASSQLNVGPGDGLTIECWINPADIAGPQPLVEWFQGSGPPWGVHFWISEAGSGTGPGCLYVNLPDLGGGEHKFSSAANIVTTNQWQHVAMTYDRASGVARLIYNGSVVAQQNLGSYVPQTTYPVYLGYRPNGTFQGARYKGGLDEVTIYNRALTTLEIQMIIAGHGEGKCPLPPPPVITQHPTNRTVNANATAQFSVIASGAPTLRYQWFFADNPLPNQTNATLSIANALPANQGIYRVAVSNIYGFAISSNATLTVLTYPPVITRQPANTNVIVGSPVSLSVQATGSVTLAYQWLSNGIPMPGRTSTSLTFQSAQFSNAANYSVIVTNPYGAVTSSVATLTVNPIPSCVAVHDGLVSWWKGENNTIDNWDSNNGVIPTANTGTIGKVGRTFINPYITVNDSPSLRVTNGLTLEAWINTTSLSGTRVLISKFEYPLNQSLGTQSAYLFGTTNNGALFFTLTPNGSVRTNTTLVTTNLIPLNTWTHVAATYDGSVMRLYINGTQVGQTNFTNNIFPGSAPLGIGGFATVPASTSSAWQYSGLMDEISLYNRALSAAEIQSIVAADFAGKCLAPPVVTKQPVSQIIPLGEDVKFNVEVSGSRPLAYQWYFNGTDIRSRIFGATNATLIIEKVRTNNNGFYFVTVSNSAGTNISSTAKLDTTPAPSCVDVLPGLISWWPADGNFLDAMGLNNAANYSPGTYPTGKVATAFTFNGINSRVSVNTTSLNFTNNQNFSIEMWIKAAITNLTYANVPLLEKFDGFRGYSLSLYNGRLAFAMGAQTASGATSSKLYLSSGSDLRDAFFHHVAVTVDRTNSNGGVLYVDGSPVLVFDPRVYTNSLLNQLPLFIGAPFSTITNSYFNGLIDEPAIYGRALTPQEILAIRTAGAAGRCKSRPTILVQPASVNVQQGSNTTLTVQAIGTPLLRYQWRRNGASLFNATNASLVLTNVTLNNAGTYSVIVSNIFGSVTSSNAIVTVSNSPPVASNSFVTVNEDSLVGITPIASDPERNPLTYTIVSQPTNGTLVQVSAFPIYQYRPNPNYFGPDAFVFKVNDGFSDSSNAVVSINVLPINDAPVAFSEQFIMDEDTVLPIQLRADDVDDTELTFIITQQPAHGTLIGDGSKRAYTPNADYNGDDYFTFIARDGSNAVSQIAVISITVNPVNDAPVARILVSPLDQLPGETNTVLISPACCDTTLILDGTESSDIENDALTYIWMDGTNVIGTTAMLTNRFAPGVHEFTLIVSDGALTGAETLTVEILKTEDAVLHLQTLVQSSSLRRNEKAALINWLRVTVNALEHCNVDQAVKFLERFEGRVAERISLINAQDAERWIDISEAIRAVAGLCDTTERPDCDGKGRDKDRDRGEHGDNGKSKHEQEQRGDRGNSEAVRAGRSSPR